MPRQPYDRYSILKNDDGTIDTMPFIKISERPSDKYEYWNVGFSRLDKLANKYYGNSVMDFLILYANPQYLSEFDIPDNTLIRIPFPLADVRKEYEDKMERFKNR
jgi:hypothetical protein